MQAAREFQSTKEVEEALRRLNIDEKKQLSIAKKEEKRKERVERLKAAAESQVAKAIERQVLEEANAAAKQRKKRLSLLQRPATKATQASMSPRKQSKQSTIDVVVVEEEVVGTVTLRGRQTRRPKHLL